jgi:hypothetical protein
MSDVVPFTGSPHVPPVEPELLGSAVFLFTEYLENLSRDAANDEEAPEETPEIDTRAVLDLFAGDLGTSVTVTLALFLRVTALFRLLAAHPALAAQAAEDPVEGGNLSTTALLAASRLDLGVKRQGAEGAADFEPRAFATALSRD